MLARSQADFGNEGIAMGVGGDAEFFFFFRSNFQHAESSWPYPLVYGVARAVLIVGAV